MRDTGLEQMNNIDNDIDIVDINKNNSKLYLFKLMTIFCEIILPRLYVYCFLSKSRWFSECYC